MNEMTETTKHTPGPWRAINNDNGSGYYISGPYGPLSSGKVVRYSDAVLISAAPYLLAACELVINCADHPSQPATSRTVTLYHDDLDVLRDAIAKAKGVQCLT
jgi:hypothetical protein